MRRLAALPAICVLATAGALVAPVAQAATGSWTRITSPVGPGSNLYQFYDASNDPSLANAKITITGSTSPDIQSGAGAVDIWCFSQADSLLSSDAPLNASPLTVDGSNVFTGQIKDPDSFPCALRAVPAGAISSPTEAGEGLYDAPSGYWAAYSGPSVFFGVKAAVGQGAGDPKVVSETIGWNTAGVNAIVSPAIASHQEGGVLAPLPEDNIAKSGSLLPEPAMLGFNDANVTAGSPSHSEVVIDGHNAYTPAVIGSFLADPSTGPAITYSATRSASTHLISVTESDPLYYCLGDSYPQSTSTPTCDAISTGVTFARTYVGAANGALALVHDSWQVTHGAHHSLSVEYNGTLPSNPEGSPGVMLPGQSSYAPAPADATVHLSSGVHSIGITTESFGSDGDADRADIALTYTAAPTLYFASANAFALRYTHTVKAGTPWRLGWAISDGFDTKTVKGLAAKAASQLIHGLHITSPKNKSTTKSKAETVKGTVSDSANGLPATVTVTGGRKTVHATVKSTGAWSVTVPLKKGKHALTASATDPNGASMSARVIVTRK
jgi:hypothetical protein